MDEHTLAIAVVGAVLGGLGFLLSRQITTTDTKIDGIAETQRQHGERLVRTEEKIDGLKERVDGIEQREREEVTGRHAMNGRGT